MKHQGKLRHSLGRILDRLPIGRNLNLEFDLVAVYLACIVGLPFVSLYPHRYGKRDVITVDLTIFNRRLTEHVTLSLAAELVAVHFEDEGSLDGSVRRFGGPFPGTADVRGQRDRSPHCHYEQHPLHRGNPFLCPFPSNFGAAYILQLFGLPFKRARAIRTTPGPLPCPTPQAIVVR